jgi:hypothetical protein
LAFLLSESELLLTAIEKIAFSGQRTHCNSTITHLKLVYASQTHPVGYSGVGHNLAKFHKPYRASATGLLSRVWFEH